MPINATKLNETDKLLERHNLMKLTWEKKKTWKAIANKKLNLQFKTFQPQQKGQIRWLHWRKKTLTSV